MSYLPASLVQLVQALGRLPGIGPRSAERLALHLVQADPAISHLLSQALLTARDQVSICRRCGGLAETQPCALCNSDQRDRTVLCVVERALDVISLEKAGTYKGQYHVLGGKLSPLNGVGPEDLRIVELEERLADETVKEVILALSSDVEGDATCHYLVQGFAGRTLKVTRIASGLPAGGGLEFADQLTLSHALDGRREMK